MEDKSIKKSEKTLRNCELLVTFILGVSLFYAFFCIRELKKEIKYLAVQNAESQYKISELEDYCSFFSTDKSPRIFNKREIKFDGDKTLKQITNDEKLEELKENDTHVSPLQTIRAITVSSFERAKESDIQMEKPQSGNLTEEILTTSRTNHARKLSKVKSSKKKFAAIVQEPTRENKPKDSNKPIVVHYSASLANHSLRHHPLHKGNGLITLPSSLYQYWIPVNWTEDLGTSDSFFSDGSNIKVNRSGLYLIYSQIQYTTKKDHNGYKIIRNTEPIAQCIFTKTFNHDEPSVQTCALTTVAALSSDDKIYIQDISHNPTVALSPEKSFFGMILITPT